MIEHLILNGYVEPSGIDSHTGEMLYRFTQAAKDIFPELQRQIEEDFYKDIMFFWESGFVEMNILDPNPVVRLTKKAFDRNVLMSLSPAQLQSLHIIIDALRVE